MTMPTNGPRVPAKCRANEWRKLRTNDSATKQTDKRQDADHEPLSVTRIRRHADEREQNKVERVTVHGVSRPSVR